MNKEKGVLLAALVMLGLMAYGAWSVLPELKTIGAHRRTDLRAREKGLDDGLLVAGDVSGYLEGLDPFFWKGAAPVGPPPSIDDTNKPPEPPEPPRGLKAVPDDGKVRLSWDPSPTPNVMGYMLRYGTDEKQWGPDPVTKGTRHTVRDLANGTTYTFLVSAVGPGGLESGPVSVNAVPEEQTVPDVPDPPKPPIGPTVAKRGYALPVSYIGSVKVGGDAKVRKVIFKDDETGEYVRLMEGDTYKDIKVIEVRVNSVILENEKGEKFTLPQGGL
jgi:hypothetical protein